MSTKLGSIVYGSEHSDDEVFLGRDFSSSKNYSDKTAAEIDDEIRSIVDKAYAQCTEIINDNISKLHFVAEYLINNEIMDEEQFRVAMSTDATMEDLIAIKNRKVEQSKAENREAADNSKEEKPESNETNENE